MKNELNEILNRLRTEHLGMSDKDFSKNYLKRNPTYYAFLKSTNKEPSMAAMVSLWKHLRREAEICEHRLHKAQTPVQKYFIEENLTLYRELADKAFTAVANKNY